jgi:hypothetical protein
LRAPLSRVGELIGDLFAQIPRQDEDVVRPCLRKLIGRENRNVRARREATVLVGAAVDEIVDEIGADAAEIE